MSSLRGVFEIAIPVRDLERAEAFYCDTLGLESGLRETQRNWHFLWVGDRDGMVVLQETPEPFPSMHFAFRVARKELEAATKALQEHGVETQGPVHHDWMDADSLYFADPDGHALEFCAVD